MGYPNALLVSPLWLNERLNDPALALLDIRAAAPYSCAHIPGASSFSVPHCKSAALGTSECLDEEALAAQLGALGISPRDSVVLYDEQLSQNAALAFWALEYAGQAQVYILDGGFAAWQAAGLPVTRTTAPRAALSYTLAPRPVRAYAADLPPAAPHHLLDVRGAQEYRAAHIEGATHCCWHDLIEELHTNALRAPDALAARLRALGVAPDDEITTYCRSGARAAFVYFVLRLMGCERVRLYDGSMNDWLLRERPTVSG